MNFLGHNNQFESSFSALYIYFSSNIQWYYNNMDITKIIVLLLKSILVKNVGNKTGYNCTSVMCLEYIVFMHKVSYKCQIPLKIRHLCKTCDFFSA